MAKNFTIIATIAALTILSSVGVLLLICATAKSRPALSNRMVVQSTTPTLIRKEEGEEDGEIVFNNPEIAKWEGIVEKLDSGINIDTGKMGWDLLSEEEKAMYPTDHRSHSERIQSLLDEMDRRRREWEERANRPRPANPTPALNMSVEEFYELTHRFQEAPTDEDWTAIENAGPRGRAFLRDAFMQRKAQDYESKGADEASSVEALKRQLETIAAETPANADRLNECAMWLNAGANALGNMIIVYQGLPEGRMRLIALSLIGTVEDDRVAALMNALLYDRRTPKEERKLAYYQSTSFLPYSRYRSAPILDRKSTLSEVHRIETSERFLFNRPFMRTSEDFRNGGYQRYLFDFLYDGDYGFSYLTLLRASQHPTDDILFQDTLIRIVEDDIVDATLRADAVRMLDLDRHRDLVEKLTASKHPAIKSVAQKVLAKGQKIRHE